MDGESRGVMVWVRAADWILLIDTVSRREYEAFLALAPPTERKSKNPMPLYFNLRIVQLKPY